MTTTLYSLALAVAVALVACFAEDMLDHERRKAWAIGAIRALDALGDFIDVMAGSST